MTARARVAAFGALLAAIFALAAIGGRAAGPIAIPGAERPDHAGRVRRPLRNYASSLATRR